MLKRDVFQHQLLEPIAKDGKLLNLNFNEALTNNRSTYLITGECTTIGESIICNEHHLKDVSGDTCYSKILRGISGDCDLVEAPRGGQVKRISSNYIIITGDENIPITTNCGLSSRNISGDMLIFFRNCTVNANHTSFTDIEYVWKQQPVIIPLNGLKIIGKSISTNLTIHTLKEINLQTRQKLQLLHIQQKNSTLGTSLAIIAVVIILILYLSKDHSTCTQYLHSQNEPGRSVLQEGAVTERIQSSHIDEHPAATHRAAPVIETSNISILPSLAATAAQQIATSKPKTTTTQQIATPKPRTTTTTRLIGTTRTADVAGYPTPHIRT